MVGHAVACRLAQDETAPTMDEGAVVQGQIARQRLTPADTSSFRATLHGFIDACNEVYDLAASTTSSTDMNVRLLPAFDRIRDCLDLRA